MYFDYLSPYREEIGQLHYYDRQQPEGYFGPPTGGPSPMPMVPPPAFSPPIPAWQQGPSGMRNCLFRNTYIWIRNGNSFWFFPTFVSRSIIMGYRWSGFGWIYHIINPNSVRSYNCF